VPYFSASDATAGLVPPQREVVPAIDPGQGIVFYSFDDAYGTWWEHNGGDLGVSTNMFFDAATNTGLITLTNSDGDHGPIREAILDALDSLANEYVADIACTIALPTSTPELVRPAEVQVYPNPAEDHFSLSTGTCVGLVRIMDMTGKLVLSQPCSSRIDVRHLDPGTYHVLIGNDRVESVSRLVKL
jgi:hypothetical protein